MKLIIFLIFFATFCKFNFSLSIRNDFKSFQNYRNVLAYILNQTKSIDGMILDEVENLIGYAEQPDDYPKTIGDSLIKSLYNEPQVPYFDEFGAGFHELSCQEIEEELKILFEVSKHFVMKAIRNEETIKILKTLVSDLAKIGYENYGLISNVIDTIADNYAAQNHVFTMIENLDDEIQMEIDTIARNCKQVDEEVEEPKDDGWMNIGQNLLELIGVKGNEDLETPELMVFEGDVDTAADNLDSEPKDIEDLNQFEQFEDSKLNKSVENLAPIVINLVVEPESPEADENLAETEEILNLLLENPEAVELLLDEIIKPEVADEAVDESELKEDTRSREIIGKGPNNEDFEQGRLDADLKNEDWNEDSENQNLDFNNLKLEALKSKNINQKGLVVEIPYPEEENIKNVQKLAKNSEDDPKILENPGIVPEAGNFKVIFPIKDEEIDQVDDIDEKTLEKSMENEVENEEEIMMEPENLSLETEEDPESQNNEDLSFQKSSNLNENHQNKDKIVDSGNNEANQLQNEEKSPNSQEFVEFDAENFNNEFDNSEMKSNFNNFLKVPENFWEIPLGFWQSFQNFLQNITNAGPNSVNSDQDFNDFDQNETEFEVKLDEEERSSRVGGQVEDKSAEDSENQEWKLEQKENEEIEKENFEENDEENDENFDNEENSLKNDENLNIVDTNLSKNEATKVTENKDEETLNSDMIEVETFKADGLKEDKNVEQFDFEEGINGIDDEIVAEIKENKKKSGNDDTKNSKNPKFKAVVENEILRIDGNSDPKDNKPEIPNKPKTFDDENNKDFATIDNKLEESEIKEDNFVPQFSEDKDDNFGGEVLEFLGFTNEKEESEDKKDNFEITDSKNSQNARGSLKIQNLTNQEEAEILEQQKQLMLELQDEEDSDSHEIDEKFPILDEFDLSNEFEGEDFDDEIIDDEEFSKSFENDLKESEGTKSEGSDESEESVGIKLSNKNHNINKISKNSKKNEKMELKNQQNNDEDMNEVKEQEIQELEELMEENGNIERK